MAVPQVVLNYLEQHGLVAIDAAELDALRNPIPDSECPYPLFTNAWGRSHEEYLGDILRVEDDPSSGLAVTRCAACGNIEISVPVPYS